MAVDGINIIDSDLAHDIRGEILDLYDNKISGQEIILHLKTELQKHKEPLSREIFITSSCLTLWEIGLLDDYFLGQLKTVVSNGAAPFWLDHFDPITHDRRNTALRELLTKVGKPAIRKRKPKKYRQRSGGHFSKGDVIKVKIDGGYHCIIFDHFWQYRNDAYYSFVATTYSGCAGPSADDLLAEEVPVTKTKTGETGVRRLDVYYKSIEKLLPHFIKIGEATLDPKTVQAGFSSYSVHIDNPDDFKKELEAILEGRKAGLYEIILDLTVADNIERD